jgi:pyruvate kinase
LAIIATLGPSFCKRKDIITSIEYGVQYFRQPLAYKNQDHLSQYLLVKEIARNKNTPCIVIPDFPSDRLRIGKIMKCIKYEQNTQLSIVDKEETNQQDEIPVPGIKQYINDIAVGENLLVRDGNISIKITNKTKTGLLGLVQFAKQRIKTNNNLVITNCDININQLTSSDINYLKKLKEEGQIPFYINISLVKNAINILKCRKQLSEVFGSKTPRIMTKIETKESLDNISDIVRESDCIMVARGDLAMAVNIEVLPYIQKKIIMTCRIMNKPVVVATQILENFADHLIPNRSELNDIALAVRQGATGIMLSRETSGSEKPLSVINLAKKVIDYEISKCPRHEIAFNSRFPIIAIEGIDGAGKTAVATALAKSISGDYIATPPIEYNPLKSFFELPERSSKARLLFYAGSLWDIWEDITERCKIRSVVLDRYTLSTLLYHEVLLKEDLSNMYNIILPPCADITITLDVSEKTALIRLQEKATESFDTDLENDRSLQMHLGKKFKKYSQYVINTDLLTIDQVVNECIVVINNYINKNKSNSSSTVSK